MSVYENFTGSESVSVPLTGGPQTVWFHVEIPPFTNAAFEFTLEV